MNLIGRTLSGLVTVGLLAGCSDAGETPMGPEADDSEAMVAALDAGDLAKRLGGYSDPRVERYKGAVPFKYNQVLGGGTRCSIGNNTDYNGLPFDQSGADFDWNEGLTWATADKKPAPSDPSKISVKINYDAEAVEFNLLVTNPSAIAGVWPHGVGAFRGTVTVKGTGTWILPRDPYNDPTPGTLYWTRGMPFLENGTWRIKDWSSHGFATVTSRVVDGELVDVDPVNVWCSLTLNPGLRVNTNSISVFDGGNNPGKGNGKKGG